MTDESTTILRTRDLSVTFGGLKAVEKVSLVLKSGEVTVLVGKNGSGKTTLLNAISGFVPAVGEMVFDNRAISSTVAWQRARLGIVRTFQMPRTFARLSNEESLAVSQSSQMLGTAGTVFARTIVAIQSLRVLRIPTSEDLSNSSARELGKSRVEEFKRVRTHSPKVALIDEPFSGLGTHDIELIIDQIHALTSTNCAVLLVEHQLDIAISIGSSVVELDRGKCVFSGNVREFEARGIVGKG